MEAVGTVTDGRGIAAPQMAAHPEQSWDEFGWVPVPGTLNLNAERAQIDTVRRWPQATERSDKARTFHLARIGTQDVAVRCYMDTLEVAAPVHLREAFGLANGDKVTLTPRASVSVAIMAHRKREAWAVDLAGRLACGIVWDRRSNVWDTASRAWRAHLPDASHHLVIQDDAVIPDGLVTAAHRIAEACPDRPVTLTTIGYRIAQDRAAYDAAVRAGRRWFPMSRGVSTVAMMIPTQHIGPMLEWCEGQRSRHDDVRIMAYFRQAGLPVVATIPSLVDHRDIDVNPTLVEGNDRTWKTRTALNVAAGDVSALEWPPFVSGRRTVRATKGEQVEIQSFRLRKDPTQVVEVEVGSASWRRITGKLSSHWVPLDVAPDPVEAPTSVDTFHVGAGWYQLPDGSKVRGRDAAEAALT